jgi:hypothetical protein
VVAQVAVRIGVESAAVALDRLAHALRMRGEHERVEVADVAGARELRLHRRPAARADRRLRRPAAARDDACGRGAGQQLLAREPDR